MEVARAGLAALLAALKEKMKMPGPGNKDSAIYLIEGHILR
jgi:hypothetical protein